MSMAAVSADNISFSYGDKKVITGLNLTVMPGKHIGLIGPSGCGKSTLLKLIAGLYPVSGGSLSVMGRTQDGLIRQNVSMVMQNAPLFPTSIRDNITCGHPMSEDRVWAACEAAQLSRWIRTLPDGLDTFAGERGNRLSGGQAQRIAVARAIAKDAPLVLLDEATSALDGETEQALLVALQNLMADRTVISCTHRLGALEGFDEVYRMEGGELFREDRAVPAR